MGKVCTEKGRKNLEPENLIVKGVEGRKMKKRMPLEHEGSNERGGPVFSGNRKKKGGNGGGAAPTVVLRSASRGSKAER